MSESIDWLKTVKPKYKKGKASVKVKGVPSSGKGLTFNQRLAKAQKRLQTARANAPKINPSREQIVGAKETKTNKPAWGSIRMGIIEDRAKTEMLNTSYVKKNVIVPKGHEIVEGEDDRTSKVQKAPGQSAEQIRLRVPSGAAEDTKGVITEKVTKMGKTKRPFWRDFYTNEVITNPDNIEIDHLIPVTEMRKRGVLLTQRKQELFGHYLKNLVITKGDTNQKKSGSPLGKFQATHDPERYSRRYHDVLKEFGGVMSHGERQQYKKDTGEEPSIASQHVRDAQRGEHVSKTQYRHDAVKKRMNAKKAQP